MHEKKCISCLLSLPLSDYYHKSGRRARESMSRCKACWKKYYWDKRNTDEGRKRRRELASWRNLSPEARLRVNARQEAYRQRHPERAKESKKRSDKKIKLSALLAYGGPRCVCCGENDPIILTLDHINNDGKKHRDTIGMNAGGAFYGYLKKNDWPNDPPLQVLCYNCNMAKEYNQGMMPLWRKKNRVRVFNPKELIS